MGVRVSVSEHVIMAGDYVFAETSLHVFSLRVEPRKMLDVGNRVRHYREIDLTDWQCFCKTNDELPDLYLEAAL